MPPCPRPHNTPVLLGEEERVSEDDGTLLPFGEQTGTAGTGRPRPTCLVGTGSRLLSRCHHHLTRCAEGPRDSEHRDGGLGTPGQPLSSPKPLCSENALGSLENLSHHRTAMSATIPDQFYSSRTEILLELFAHTHTHTHTPKNMKLILHCALSGMPQTEAAVRWTCRAADKARSVQGSGQRSSHWRAAGHRPGIWRSELIP